MVHTWSLHNSWKHFLQRSPKCCFFFDSGSSISSPSSWSRSWSFTWYVGCLSGTHTHTEREREREQRNYLCRSHKAIIRRWQTLIDTWDLICPFNLWRHIFFTQPDSINPFSLILCWCWSNCCSLSSSTPIVEWRVGINSGILMWGGGVLWVIVGFCSVKGSQPVSDRSLLITSLKAYVCSFSSSVVIVVVVVGVGHVTSSCRFSSAAWILFLFLCSFFLCLCLFLPDPSETCCSSISALWKSIFR